MTQQKPERVDARHIVLYVIVIGGLAAFMVFLWFGKMSEKWLPLQLFALAILAAVTYNCDKIIRLAVGSEKFGASVDVAQAASWTIEAIESANRAVDLIEETSKGLSTAEMERVLGSKKVNVVVEAAVIRDSLKKARTLAANAETMISNKATWWGAPKGAKDTSDSALKWRTPDKE